MAVIEAIQTTYLEADATSVTFDISSSPGNTYEHLQLRIHAKSDRTGATNDDVALNFNGDTNSNYSHYRMMGSDSAETVTASTGVAYIKVSSIQAVANLSGAANYGGVIVDILDYRNGSKNTTVSGMGSLTVAPIGSNRATLFSGLWDDVAAVTSIVLAPLSGTNFIRGSEFTLYGLNSS